MAKGGKDKSGSSSAVQANPEAEERKRLRKLAISKNLLSETPVKASLALNPSKTLLKHHGADVLRKSNRKNRFLFQFPGLIAPVSGGKLGELKDLGTKNPILYLDFPQGRMKLFGTIVYPKNRYLTLQFSKTGKNVMCEDYFDTMIVFADAWWIGTSEENPEETKLSFPENMNTGQQKEPDFKGGAGSTTVRKQGASSSRVTEVKVKHQSPVHEVEDILSDSENDLQDLTEKTPTRNSARTSGKKFNELSDSENDLQILVDKTPTRHSARTSGKKFKFAESSSADDAFDLDDKSESSNEEENVTGGSPISENMEDVKTEVIEEVIESSISATKVKDKGSLVQATISTLFKKKEEKMATSTSLSEKGKAVRGRKASGTKSTPRKKPKVSDDEIEEISDPSEDSSDEDWDA